MAQETDNHELNLYEDGDVNWTHRPDMATIEERLIVRDSEAARTDYTPYSGAVFIAQDTGAVYDGEGGAWSLANRQFDGVSINNLLDDLDANGNQITGLSDIQGPFRDEFDDHMGDPSAHHERYGDIEAQNAVQGADISIGGHATDTRSELQSHAEENSAHHSRYTNDEARQAMHGIDAEFNSVTIDNQLNGGAGRIELGEGVARHVFNESIRFRYNPTDNDLMRWMADDYIQVLQEIRLEDTVDASQSDGFILPRRSSRPSGTESGRMIYRTDKD